MEEYECLLCGELLYKDPSTINDYWCAACSTVHVYNQRHDRLEVVEC